MNNPYVVDVMQELTQLLPTNILEHIRMSVNLEQLIGSEQSSSPSNLVIDGELADSSKITIAVVEAIKNIRLRHSIYFPPAEKSIPDLVSELKLPIDQNVGIVEMTSAQSFDALERNFMLAEIFGEAPHHLPIKRKLETMISRFGDLSKDKPGLFNDQSLLKNRRVYLPALIFHHSTTQASPLEEFFGKPTNISKSLSQKDETSRPSPLDFFGEGTERRMKEDRAKIDKIYGPYEAVLKGYVHKAELGKWQFFNDDPNQGYKFHLNVKPENVRQVAAHLKLGNYYHKYLSGGEVENGKIFTVYTGSKQQTEQIVRDIADSEIALLLDRPIADESGEVLYAPNIVGRFVGNRNKYLTKVPRFGISILRSTNKDSLDQSYSKTHEALLAEYGDYYGGGITYYKTTK